MAKIQQLSPHIADLIAAGEVVERPASCAKELVENAIDAGATQITVEIRDGGMTFLRVSDNGCGIPAEDVPTAFLRHATSKLRKAEDLEAIHTLGFRGEALAAISSVSRMDVLTRTEDTPFGLSLHLEAGVVTESSEAGCPKGTTMIVRDLFYNTPARMKFMKSDSVEASALLSSMQRLALAHPNIAFRVLRDGVCQLETAGDGELYSAIYAVMGKQNAKEMVKVESRWDKYSLSGYVSKPTASRGNRTQQIFFVNGRLVRSKTFTTALETAYANRIMQGRYPYCVLHLRLPEHLVDVNVHPAKIEVKFLNERDIFDTIRYGVEGALDQSTDRPRLKLPSEAPKESVVKIASPTFYRNMTAAEYRDFTQIVQQTPKAKAYEPVRPTAAKPFTPPPIPVEVPKKEVTPVVPTVAKETVTPVVPEPAVESEPVLLPQEAPWRLVGEVLDTYIIVEQGEAVLLIDKHAAHERILFERLRANQEPVMPQLLLTPILLTPEREEATVLLENTALLEELGFSLRDFGDGTLALSQLPADLDASEAEATLNAMATELLSGKRLDSSALRDNLLHTIACKAAIKGGRHSDEKERNALIQEVMSRPELKHCPHGRPICITLSRSQLERQFKR